MALSQVFVEDSFVDECDVSGTIRGHSIELSGVGVTSFVESIKRAARERGRGYGDMFFVLVSSGVEYRGCTLSGSGSIARVHFLTSVEL